uniref:non-specific serine/threonine protein kinase n=1 Tax=Brassica oleracea var. oleracea TaxID=109376 RepID=A0A0D3CVU0_BRAOL
MIIDLSRNYLNGSIPPEWGTLQLINLILSSNYLTGDIPSTFSKPTALTDLRISNNSLPELYQISSRTGQNLQNSLYDLHINCGGDELTISGTKYEADNSDSIYYASRTAWVSSNTGRFLDDERHLKVPTIWTNTSEPSSLYTDARLSAISLTYYAFCLGEGSYTVNLHFAETGKLEVKDFDIVSEAKGAGRAVVKSFQAMVTNGTLEIRLFWALKLFLFHWWWNLYWHNSRRFVGVSCALNGWHFKVERLLETQESDGERALFGPLETRIQLDWPIRQKICVGIASGLAYLHGESRLKIVQRDIKATNVLLDKELNLKISDFGLAKLDEEENTHMSTQAAGTYGYMVPEYAMRGHLTDKADVYSFGGVVALEIVHGRSSTSAQSVYLLIDWLICPVPSRTAAGSSSSGSRRVRPARAAVLKMADQTRESRNGDLGLQAFKIPQVKPIPLSTRPVFDPSALNPFREVRKFVGLPNEGPIPPRSKSLRARPAVQVLDCYPY